MTSRSGGSSRRPRIGLVGAGMAAGEHFKAFSALPEAVLSGVVTGTSGETAEAAERWSVPGYHDLAAMLDDPLLDAVIVASPTPLHVAQVTAALGAGKHVLVEKPVASTEAEIWELDQLARAQGLVCMPAHVDIYYPPLWQARDLLQGGELGALVYANFAALHSVPAAVSRTWRTAMAQEGALADSGVHQVYQAHFVLGPPATVVAQLSRVALPALIDDIASVGLSYASGTLATVIQGWAADDISSSPWVLSVKLVGTRGAVWINHDEQMAGLATPGGRQTIDLNPDKVPFGQRFTAQLRHFVAAIGGGAGPLSTLADAAACQRVIDLAYQSAREERLLHYTTPASARN